MESEALDAKIVRAASFLHVQKITVRTVPLVRSQELKRKEQRVISVAPASMPVEAHTPATIAKLAGPSPMGVGRLARVVVQGSTRTRAERQDAKFALLVSTSIREERQDVMAALITNIQVPAGAIVKHARMAKVETTTRQAATTVVAINIPVAAAVTIVQAANLLTPGRRAA
jgi:hypothetical protein